MQLSITWHKLSLELGLKIGFKELRLELKLLNQGLWYITTAAMLTGILPLQLCILVMVYYLCSFVCWYITSAAMFAGIYYLCSHVCWYILPLQLCILVYCQCSYLCWYITSAAMYCILILLVNTQFLVFYHLVWFFRNTLHNTSAAIYAGITERRRCSWCSLSHSSFTLNKNNFDFIKYVYILIIKLLGYNND